MPDIPSPSERDERLERILADYLHALEAGTAPDRADLLKQHPDLAAELGSFFRNRNAMERIAEPIKEQLPALAETIGAFQSHGAGVGTTIRYFGDYELLEEIARGGMGVVYRAKQVSLNRIVAVKMILAGQLASEGDVQRFKTEAEAAAGLDHPNIVPIYEVGEHEGQHYFSMKLVEGGSLAQELAGKGVASGNNKQRQRWAAQLLVTIARALHHAHQRRILHRDLKPANILLDAAGQPHISDFGLAKRVEGTSNLTQSGAIVGTPAYMAPEQVRSEKQLTTGVDVYSLGAILYELLTGRPPFQANTPFDTLMLVLDRDPVPPHSIRPEIDRDLETICMKCMHKQPESRYESAAALAEDLQRWLHGEPILARPVGRSERLWRWCRRNPVVAALTAAVVVAMLAGTAVSTYFALNAAEEAQRAEANARTAENNERAATKQSLLAKTQGERARQNELAALGNLYVSRMSQAWQSWQVGDAGRVRELLDGTEPERTGGQDFRGFEWHYLRHLLNSERSSLRGPWTSANKLSLAFRGHTSQLALAGEGFFQKPETLVWDATTGKHLRSLPGARAVAFSADGKLLATIESAFGPVVVRDADTGKELASLAGDNTAAAFSADGKLLAAVVRGEGGVFSKDDLRVWDWATGKVVGTFAGYGWPIQGVALSPDGKLLAAGGYANVRDVRKVPFTGRLPAGKVWDVAKGKELWVITHPGGVLGLAFAPDGRRLATAGADRVARVWDAPTGKELLTLVGHGGVVSAVAFSADGKLLATSGHDQTVRMWSAEDGRLLRVYRGHTSPVLSVAFSADGHLLAAAAADGTVKIWDAARDQEAIALPVGSEATLALAFDPQGNRLAVGTTAGLRVWSLSSGKVLEDYRSWFVNKNVFAVGYSADGKRLISVANTLLNLKHYVATVRDEGNVVGTLAGTAMAGVMALSPDGKRLAVASQHLRMGPRSDKGLGENAPPFWVDTIELWDPFAGRIERTLERKAVSVLAFSRDGKRLALVHSTVAAGKPECRVDVVEAAGGKMMAQFAVGEDQIAALAFTPDGGRLLSAGMRRVKVWEIEGGKLVNDFALGGRVLKAAFSPDGTRLVTGSDDGRLTLWHVATGQEMLPLSGFRAQVLSHALAFSPDGRLLAAGGSDGQEGLVKIWDGTPKAP